MREKENMNMKEINREIKRDKERLEKRKK